MRTFDDFQKRLLYAFTRHVARDRRIFAFARNFVDFVDKDDTALCGFDVAVCGVYQF